MKGANPFEVDPFEDSEALNQTALFSWLAMCGHLGKDAANDRQCYEVKGYAHRHYFLAPIRVTIACAVIYAVPNGAHLKGGALAASRLIAQGLRPGVCDVVVPVPMAVKIKEGPRLQDEYTREFHGMYLELKTPAGRKKFDRAPESDDQKTFIRHMKSLDYRAEVREGWVDAAAAIADYLQL